MAVTGCRLWRRHKPYQQRKLSLSNPKELSATISRLEVRYTHKQIRPNLYTITHTFSYLHDLMYLHEYILLYEAMIFIHFMSDVNAYQYQ